MSVSMLHSYVRREGPAECRGGVLWTRESRC